MARHPNVVYLLHCHSACLLNCLITLFCHVDPARPSLVSDDRGDKLVLPEKVDSRLHEEDFRQYGRVEVQAA